MSYICSRYFKSFLTYQSCYHAFLCATFMRWTVNSQYIGAPRMNLHKHGRLLLHWSIHVCKRECVCMCCPPKHALQRQMARVPSAPVFTLPFCVARCMCVPWRRATLCSDRDWRCGPWWLRRDGRQQTEVSGLTWEHPTQRAREEDALCLLYGAF